jgi:hypothetical protein
LVARIGLFEIARNHNRHSTASGGNFGRQRRQAIRASRHQNYAMAVCCENARQFGAYSCRGTGNQRHTFSHDSMLLNKLHDMRPTLSTRAYALGGTQATCKHIGVFKRTVPRN